MLTRSENKGWLLEPAQTSLNNEGVVFFLVVYKKYFHYSIFSALRIRLSKFTGATVNLELEIWWKIITSKTKRGNAKLKVVESGQALIPV